jgi:hypothetical protein
MYKVSYYIGGGSQVAFKWFNTFTEATDFSIKQPRESIIEIKQYDSKVSYTTNNTNDAS